jgi:NAD(P)-dependent dehydrogenase (short-subunit alcohol dehydrogenase family)
LAADVTKHQDLDARASCAASLGPLDYLAPDTGIAALVEDLNIEAFKVQWQVNGVGALNTLSTLSQKQIDVPSQAGSCPAQTSSCPVRPSNSVAPQLF